ncbi:MAG: PhzF family phenazine biosynthesis protein [Ignavibacteriaceae bacterium]
MEKVIKIFQIDAFADKAFEGNPAGVTFGDGLTGAEMQSIAKEMNLSETAFLSKSDKANYNLRWFTPSVEVDLCGHATIASLHFLNENDLIKNNQWINFETRSGILKCKMEAGRYFMQIPIYESKTFNGNAKAVKNALGIDEKEFDEKFPFVLLENGYLYIYLKTIEAISKIKPSYKELLIISDNGNYFTAVVPYTLETIDKGSFAHLRFFGPYYGIDEDPVTGSANGPLLLVLKKLGLIKNIKDEISLSFEQGDFVNRRGRIGVTFSQSKDELFISGKAVTVIKGEMNF